MNFNWDDVDLDKYTENLTELSKEDVNSVKGSKRESSSLSEGPHEDVEIKVEYRGPSKYAAGFHDIAVIFTKDDKSKKEFYRVPDSEVYTITKTGKKNFGDITKFRQLLIAAFKTPTATLSGTQALSRALIAHNFEFLNGRFVNIKIGYGKFGTSWHAGMVDDPQGSGKKVVGIVKRGYDKATNTEFLETLNDEFGNTRVFQSFEEANTQGPNLVQYYEKFPIVYNLTSSDANEYSEKAAKLLKIAEKIKSDDEVVVENDVPFSQPVVKDVEEATAGVIPSIDIEDDDDDETLDIFAEM